MSKNSKWGGYGEAIEQKQRQKWEVPLWQAAPRDRAGARMETLGLRLLHKKINMGTKINTHISMLDSRRVRSCQTFGIFVLLEYFLLSKSKLLCSASSLFLYSISSVQREKKNQNESIKAGSLLIYCQQGCFRLLLTYKGLSALETSHHLT